MTRKSPRFHFTPFPRLVDRCVRPLRVAAFCVFIGGGISPALAAVPGGDELLAARDAYKSKNLMRLDQAVERLSGNVLQPYARYWQLQARLGDASPEEIRAFLVQNADNPLADRVRSDWLRILGKRQEWDLFLAEYPKLSQPDRTLVCHQLQARLASGDRSALREGKEVWFTGADMPSSCTPVFDELAASGVLTADDIWTRIRLALELGNVGVARAISGYLPSSDQSVLRKLDAAKENPARLLERDVPDAGSRAGRELTLFAISRLARTQPDAAASQMEKLQGNLNAEERGYGWGQIAYHASRKHHPKALGWFERAGKTQLSDTQLQWKVRAALRNQDWKAVLGAIDAMSADSANEPVWRFWKARALKQQGNITAANALLVPLSREQHFYGQMAMEELGAVIGNPTQDYKATEAEIEAVKKLPGIQRALALYELDMRYEANREWIWATRDMEDRKLLAAAELARRNGWLDRAINTADRTVQLHDFGLRFLAPHREVMQVYTKQWNLDEAWVYGLIRQESRFISHARSSVGASGLMQVMPATARWIAKRLGVSDYRDSAINQLETNIAFGTYYLRHVMDTLDGYPVLATAAYNAGPGRAKRWRDSVDMEGAVYAESIPFNETRDYVKKVMSNAVYYSARFGQTLTSLKHRLGVVAGKGGPIDSADPDE